MRSLTTALLGSWLEHNRPTKTGGHIWVNGQAIVRVVESGGTTIGRTSIRGVKMWRGSTKIISTDQLSVTLHSYQFQRGSNQIRKGLLEDHARSACRVLNWGAGVWSVRRGVNKTNIPCLIVYGPKHGIPNYVVPVVGQSVYIIDSVRIPVYGSIWAFIRCWIAMVQAVEHCASRNTPQFYSCEIKAFAPCWHH